MFTIQPAGNEAIPTIQQLANQTWAVAYKDILDQAQMKYMLETLYSTTTLEYQHNQLHFQSILAIDDGKPIGFASYSPSENKPGIFRLHKIYILPGQQGKGIGQSLLNYVIADMKTKGATILELNVNRQNKARTFYEKLGFIVIGEEDIPIGNGYFMNDYVMQKTILSS